MQNIADLQKHKQQKQEQEIQKAINKGHLSPLRSEKKCKAFLNRRYILSFENLNVQDIIPANIRFNDIDIKYCAHDLGPRLDQYEQLNTQSQGFMDPIMVTKLGNGKYSLDSGHNRYYTQVNIRKRNKIPAFVISSASSLIQSTKDKIKSNQKSADYNRNYSMEDVVSQLILLYEQQSSASEKVFNDISDSKQFDHDFSIIMNELYPHEFLSNIARGKIKKAFMDKMSQGSTSIVTFDESYRSDVLNRNAYPSQYYKDEKGKVKKTAWPNYLCQKQNAIIGLGTSNARNNEGMVFSFMQQVSNNLTYQKETKGYNIHLVCEIYRPKPSVFELAAQREQELEKISKWNNVLSSFKNGSYLITKVIFPIQLKSEQQDLIYNWNSKQNKFC